MAYASYTFYQTDFHGKLIAADDWDALAMRADAQLDALTFCRLARGAAVTDEVRRAACAAAEVYAQHAAAANAVPLGIKSENTDGYSVTYAEAARTTLERIKEVHAAIDLYLPRSSPLRYRGVGYVE